MSADPRDLNLVWLDLECAGLDDAVHPILEVGAIVTDPELRAIVSLKVVVAPDGDGWRRNMVEVVRDMHETSGLLDAVGQATDTIGDADRMLASTLDDYTVDGKAVLAGSGVAHFDRRFIAAQMPETDKRLTYWTVDVGVLRRMLLLAGRDDLVGDWQQAEATKAHRALDDAWAHLYEARHYLRALREV